MRDDGLHRPRVTGRQASRIEEVPAAHDLVQRLCALQAAVVAVIDPGASEPSDCFCGTSGYWPYRRAEDFRNAGKAVAFIETATRAALEVLASSERELAETTLRQWGDAEPAEGCREPDHVRLARALVVALDRLEGRDPTAAARSTLP